MRPTTDSRLLSLLTQEAELLEAINSDFEQENLFLKRKLITDLGYVRAELLKYPEPKVEFAKRSLKKNISRIEGHELKKEEKYDNTWFYMLLFYLLSKPSKHKQFIRLSNTGDKNDPRRKRHVKTHK